MATNTLKVPFNKTKFYHHWNKNWFQSLLLLVIVTQYYSAFAWIIQTWNESTYESWGFLAILLLGLNIRHRPRKRKEPAQIHLSAILVLALLDLICTPLRLNILSALTALLSLHLWFTAFYHCQGRWYLHPHLWFALLSLPVVYWANILFGFHLQKFVSLIAAQWLSFYGISVTAEGPLLQLPQTV